MNPEDPKKKPKWPDHEYRIEVPEGFRPMKDAERIAIEKSVKDFWKDEDLIEAVKKMQEVKKDGRTREQQVLGLPEEVL